MPVIEMDSNTKRFYQGVASANEVLEAHADVDFPDDETRIRMFWFFVGVLGAGKHGCTSQTDLENFVLGASTRAPQSEPARDAWTCDHGVMGGPAIVGDVCEHGCHD